MKTIALGQNQMGQDYVLRCEDGRVQILEGTPDGMSTLYSVCTVDASQRPQLAQALRLPCPDDDVLADALSKLGDGSDIERFFRENGIVFQQDNNNWGTTPPVSWLWWTTKNGECVLDQSSRIDVDLVFLIDLSPSMQPQIEALRSVWQGISLSTLAGLGPGTPGFRLRMRVCGFGMDKSGKGFSFVAHPFLLNDINGFLEQLNALKPVGANETTRPLLDALWTSACWPETAPAYMDQNRQCWLSEGQSARWIVVLTDGMPQGQAITPSMGGSSIGDVVDKLLGRRGINTRVFAPAAACKVLSPSYSYRLHCPTDFQETLPQMIAHIDIWTDMIRDGLQRGENCRAGRMCCPTSPIERPVAVRNTDHGCEVWTKDDGDHNVLNRLQTQQGVIVDGPVPDPSGRFEVTRVRHPDGDNLRAEQIRPFLRGQPEFTLVEYGELAQM